MKRISKRMEKKKVKQWKQAANKGDAEAYKRLFYYYMEKKTLWEKLMAHLRELRKKHKIVGKKTAARGVRTILGGRYTRKALDWARKQEARKQEAQKQEAQGYSLEPVQAYLLAMDILYDKKQESKVHAIELLEEAADAGMVNAVFQLGNCYDLGRGVEKDPEKAIELYRKAAGMGSYHAAVALKMHEVKKNNDLA